ncbi:PGRS repeat-containing protein [Mycolicibacter icosiumassiliensis]|uniref:PGRS repeat-containing protein n=1 Tax=Mycolicibacter icosiumassiliensis TaxID=1792835 RepID=UPI002E10A7EF
MQDWIDSPLGSTVNEFINPLFAFGGSCGLICNGVDGSETNVDGGAGGWIFGDGGTGWSSTDDGVAGGRLITASTNRNGRSSASAGPLWSAITARDSS